MECSVVCWTEWIQIEIYQTVLHFFKCRTDKDQAPLSIFFSVAYRL